MTKSIIKITKFINSDCCYGVEMEIDGVKENGAYCQKSKKLVIDGGITFPRHESVEALGEYLIKNLKVETSCEKYLSL